MIRNKSTVKAVIFDCDGTLVDTEPLCSSAWSAVIRNHGHYPTTEELAWGTGRSFEDCRNFFARLVPGLPDAATLHRDYWPILQKLMDTALMTFPDTLMLLELLQRIGVPSGIATNSCRSRLDYTLRCADSRLAQLPSTAADEVELPKPASDVYLSTAQKLHVAPEYCLALEDSDTGQQAAEAASMHILRVDRLNRDGIAPGRLVPEVMHRFDLEAPRSRVIHK